MLIILFEKKKSIGWHVGEKLPGNPNEIDLQVISVYADAHELEWLKDNIANLPHKKDGRHCCWFGDMAKMLADCIPRGYKDIQPWLINEED